MTTPNDAEKAAQLFENEHCVEHDFRCGRNVEGSHVSFKCVEECVDAIVRDSLAQIEAIGKGGGDV